MTMAVRMPATLSRRIRERELASDQRAGSWTRANVRRRQREFVKARWLYVLAMPLLAMVLTPLTLLMPSWSRMFLAGALVTSGIWIAVVLVLLGSGTGCLMMGDVGEQWTAQELRPLQRRGWKLINRMLLKRGDIDHVAIGPGGVLVVETKWSGDRWALDRTDARIQGAVDQVRRSSRSLRLFLKDVIGDAPVRSLVVLWDPEGRPGREIDVDGVAVVPGPSLPEWLKAVENRDLTPEAAECAWRKLERHLSDRDAYELEKEGPPPKAGLDVVWEWGRFIAALIAGVWVAAELVRVFGTVAGVALDATVLLGFGLLAHRFEKLRFAALGWLGGTQFLTVAFLGALAFDWLH
jgi:hypothetical protein